MGPPSPTKQRAGRRGGQASGRSRRGTSSALNESVMIDEAEVDKRLKSYIKRVGQPSSWPEVRIYEQVRGDIYKNEYTRLETIQKAGDLVPGEEVDKAAEGMRDLFAAETKDLAKRVAAQVDCNAKTKRELTKAIKENLTDILERIVKEVRG